MQKYGSCIILAAALLFCSARAEPTDYARTFARCAALYHSLAEMQEESGNPATAEFFRGHANGAQLAAIFSAVTSGTPAEHAPRRIDAMIEESSIYFAAISEMLAVDALKESMQTCADNHFLQVAIVEAYKRADEEGL